MIEYGQEDRCGVENGVSDAESALLDGGLGAEPNFPGDGDMDDSTERPVAGDWSRTIFVMDLSGRVHLLVEPAEAQVQGTEGGAQKSESFVVSSLPTCHQGFRCET